MKSSESIPFGESSTAAAERSPGVLGRPRYAAILSRLEQIADSPWFAYGSIFLIQAKLLWGIWFYRDLTNGDTASYFRDAAAWSTDLTLHVVYAPLYTVFYGSLKWLFSDTYDVTILHRVLIVLAASLLVLMVLRRLLPGGIAWVLALWWTLLPINYDTVYEIHLFAALPTLAAVVVAVKFSGARMRAAVFLLLIAAVLIRGELLLGLVAWVALWGGYELWRWRRGRVDLRRPRELSGRLAVSAVLTAAVLASLLPLILMGSSSQFETKQTAVLCQNYAASAQQRGEFAGAHAINKPLSCRQLMQERFGEPLPTWTDALLANPGAMGEHFLFSAELIPQGLQLMLFDQISGGPNMNPDTVPVTSGSPAAMAGLIAVASFVLYGLVLLWRDRKRWWEGWLRERAWGWAVLGCLAVAAFVVMMTVRPRPSYLFNFSVLILAVIGMSAFSIGSRWTWTRHLRAGIPLLAVVVLVAVPSRYDTGYTTPQAGQGRPLLEMVERLEPRRDELSRPDTHLLAPQFANEVCAYVAPIAGCRGTALIESIEQKQADTSIAKLIKDLNINLVYADEFTLSNPFARDLMERLDRKGWRVLGPPPSSGAPWTLLRRPDSFAETR